jgi:hypothetical protein
MIVRYRIRRRPDGLYGLWDTVSHCWVNQYGEPDTSYRAGNRGVAVMRRQDLNNPLCWKGGVIAP